MSLPLWGYRLSAVLDTAAGVASNLPGRSFRIGNRTLTSRLEFPFWFKNGADHTPIPLFADSVNNFHTDRPLMLRDLLRQSIYSRLAGYEDVNDAERLSQDPRISAD